MSCVDPKEADRFAASGDTSSPAFQAHAARCPECAGLYATVANVAARAGEAHPASSALVAFAEDPGLLSEASRAWIAKHLEQCRHCRAMLEQVPAQGHALERRRSSLRPLAAAAGWILAALLVIRQVSQPAQDHKVVLGSQTITLSQTRGDSQPRAGSQSTIQDVDVVRFACVLGEDVKAGGKLHLRVEDAAGKTVVDTEVVVDELNDSAWPVIAIKRAALPKGRLTFHVRAPSGSEIAAVVEG
jgi:hypothetical protein